MTVIKSRQHYSYWRYNIWIKNSKKRFFRPNIGLAVLKSDKFAFVWFSAKCYPTNEGKRLSCAIYLFIQVSKESWRNIYNTRRMEDQILFKILKSTLRCWDIINATKIGQKTLLESLKHTFYVLKELFREKAWNQSKEIPLRIVRIHMLIYLHSRTGRDRKAEIEVEAELK